MRKNYIKSGDIILIPVDGDLCAVAKIVYLSKYFKNVVLLNAYPLVASFSERIIKLPADSPNELLVYAGNQKIKTEEWKKLDNIPVTDKEREMSKRIVGGEVWIEDDCIRTATEEDNETLKRMLVSGTESVENKMKDYLILNGLL
jgi:hypothetical protein